MMWSLVALKTIVTKEVRRFLRIWIQTLLPSAINMALYFIIFGYLMGGRIGHMNGIDYMQFIIPGLIMMSVITNSYTNVVFSFFSQKFQRSIEELIIAPVSHWVILFGYIAGGITRGVLVGLIVLATALVFTDIQIVHWWLTLTVLFLTACLFSVMGFINALFAKKFDDVSIVPTFVLTPLTYLGGVFYSIHLLPQVWQKISLLNPIIYMVNAFRAGMMGYSEVNLSLSLAFILVMNVLAVCYALYLLNTGKGIRS